MELDDLKQSWAAEHKDLQPLSRDFMKIVKNKSYSPLNILRTKFRLQIITIPIVLIYFGYYFIEDSELKHGLIYGLLLGICIWILGFSIFNYIVVSRLLKIKESILPYIQRQVHLLEKSFKLYLWLGQIFSIALIFFFELYYQQERLEVGLPNYSISLRVAVYVVFIVLQYFISKIYFRNNYGVHLEHLKDLLKQSV